MSLSFPAVKVKILSLIDFFRNNQPSFLFKKSSNRKAHVAYSEIVLVLEKTEEYVVSQVGK